MQTSISSLALVVCISAVLVSCGENPFEGKSADELFSLGKNYYIGDGVGVDADLGCDYYEAAAELGHPEAQYRIATCYRIGLGRRKSIAKAADWYEKAASQDLPVAQNSLATIYLFETPQSNEYARAIELLVAASEAGDVMAPLTLGVAHFQGKALPKDQSKSMDYYRIAGERGNPSAQALLYHIHSEGLFGQPKDAARAEYWKSQFETNRHPHFGSNWTIPYALEQAYKSGWGVPVDPNRARAISVPANTKM